MLELIRLAGPEARAGPASPRQAENGAAQAPRSEREWGGLVRDAILWCFAARTIRARLREDFRVATRHASAVKAHRQTIKRTEHNRELRSKLRTGLKAIRAAIDAGDTATAKASLSKTFSLIDKMSAKGIIHDNAAGRYKSRLAKGLAKKSASAKSA